MKAVSAIMSQASGERRFSPTTMAMMLRMAPRSARMATPAAPTQARPQAAAMRATGFRSSSPNR